MNGLPPTVITYGGRGRGGFAINDDSARDPQVARLRPVLERLLKTTIVQPPVETDSHPVWSLHRVDAPELENPWCFAIQGRGEKYGAAGLCQFAFCDQSFGPARLWDWCTNRISDKGVLDPNLPPLDGQPTLDPVSREHAEALFDRLVREEPRIDLIGNPVQAATLFTVLLPLLPTPVIERYLWSTCLLSSPYVGNQTVVAGRWPDDMRMGDERRAARIDEWLTDPDDPDARRPRDQQRPNEPARAWLLDHPADLTLLKTVPAMATLGELLDWVEVNCLPPRMEEVAALLGKHAGRQRLLRNPEVVRQWAAQYLEQARNALGDRAAADIHPLLFDGLLEHVSTDGQRNPLAVPPAAEPFPGWHAQLATLLTERYSEKELVEFVRSLREPGFPLAGDQALAEAGPWLGQLGLTQARHPELFPISVTDIARRLAERGQLTVTDRERLAAAPDPELLLTEITRAAPSLSPTAAADLLSVFLQISHGPVTNGIDREPPIELLLSRADSAQRHRWLDDMLTSLQARGAAADQLPMAVWSALGALAPNEAALPAEIRERWGALYAAAPTLDPRLRLLLPPVRTTERVNPKPSSEPEPVRSAPHRPRWRQRSSPVPPSHVGGTSPTHSQPEAEEHGDWLVWLKSVPTVLVVVAVVVVVVVVVLCLVWMTPGGH
ncbi:MAG: hypothetical protein JO100_18955 [Pseudonocardia sp.]|nr:hypothetical protein [Pseudonocardia sp.]